MTTFGDIYQALCGWLPSEIVPYILGLVGVLVVLTIFRLVKIVLDSLPFV